MHVVNEIYVMLYMTLLKLTPKKICLLVRHYSNSNVSLFGY